MKTLVRGAINPMDTYPKAILLMYASVFAWLLSFGCPGVRAAETPLDLAMRQHIQQGIERANVSRDFTRTSEAILISMNQSQSDDVLRKVFANKDAPAFREEKRLMLYVILFQYRNQPQKLAERYERIPIPYRPELLRVSATYFRNYINHDYSGLGMAVLRDWASTFLSSSMSPHYPSGYDRQILEYLALCHNPTGIKEIGTFIKGEVSDASVRRLLSHDACLVFGKQAKDIAAWYYLQYAIQPEDLTFFKNFIKKNCESAEADGYLSQKQQEIREDAQTAAGFLLQ